MCGENINVDFVEKKYTIWLNSITALNIDGEIYPEKLLFRIPQIKNLDPKYQNSLIFVKQFWKNLGGDAGPPNSSYTLYLEGKSFPQNIESRGGNGQGGNSQIIAEVPANMYDDGFGYVFPGNAKDNGILCGDTFVNGGEVYIELVGNMGVNLIETAYRIKIEVLLVENTRTKKCGCS